MLFCLGRGGLLCMGPVRTLFRCAHYVKSNAAVTATTYTCIALQDEAIGD